MAVAESSTVIHSEHIFVVVVSRVEKVHRSQTYQNRKVARPKSAAPGIAKVTLKHAFCKRFIVCARVCSTAHKTELYSWFRK